MAAHMPCRQCGMPSTSFTDRIAELEADRRQLKQELDEANKTIAELTATYFSQQVQEQL